ncbi:hypothetical protein [Salegentibacter flavus]|uniref:DUF748 domain-containing protein n=1 Tax=Salegentibacter flavus TaxID=287099 RepID=A0A1I4XLK2_9FLAO|nr:hypothetical protein [Salegentibacter flavus]SFN26684.1 hypothetical protein SAMN05660413_00143 [Salegentibacter flavus]
MKKSSKIFLYIITGIILLALILFALNNFAEEKLKKGIQDATSQINLNYEELDVNLLSRKATLESPSFSVNGKSFKAEKLSLNNIEIFKYLTDKDLEIGEVSLDGPSFIINKSKKSKSSGDATSSGFKENILIKRLQIKNGELAIIENDSAENSLFTKFNHLKILDFQLDSSSVNNTIPFQYKDYVFKGDSIFFKLDPRHNISLGKMNIEEGHSVFNDFRIIPVYGKQEFQQHIPYELDRFELVVEEVIFSNLKWKFENDSLSIENPLVKIKNANLEVYRDKLQPDDTRQKKMYSEMIRRLPFKLKLDTIRVINSYIKYEELIDGDRSPGEVDFSNLDASIYNLSNINMQAKDFKSTEVDVKTLFMQEANLSVNWRINIQNKNDRFNISGDMNRISEEAMNRFMKPAMNVLAKGSIEDMAFNYSGNHTEALGDMRLVYKDFKVEVLRKDGRRKNKLLSALANLIMNKDAISEDVVQKQIEVTRDKTRSFWNYLWKMIRAGALKSFF